MKKSQQKILHHRIYTGARIISCVSFIILAIIGVSSLVFAMSLDNIPEENGVPTNWEIASVEQPETITVPITYWDQRVDACDDENRQFEWGKCHYWTKGALQGIVKNYLGSDHLPIPAFSDSDTAWAANHDIFTANVTGSDPVTTTDNFYRWFHEVEGVSKKISGRTITFQRTGDGATYTYGGQNIYPLDDVANFGDGDIKLRGADGKMHNFHFTGHLRIPMRITTSGLEKFQFSGDDDVWVFLNNQLVLDIGGLHEALSGWFAINTDGTVNTHINSVSNVADRTNELTECMKEVRNTNSPCNNTFNNFLVAHNQPANNTLDLGLKAGDVVYLDFFYAERSSDGSNTKITIENMDWPISADVKLAGNIIEEREKTNIAEYQTSITNHDPEHTLNIERLASYINDVAENNSASGFIPLGSDTLYYTTTPNDDNSWQQLSLSAPADSAQGFLLDTPITLSAYGTAGDTAYFRYYAETIDTTGTIDNVVSYFTSINDTKRIAHTSTKLNYERKIPDTPVDPDPIDPDPVDPTPVEPVTPVNPVTPETPTPSTPAEPELPNLPSTDIADDGLVFIAPLGQVAYVPNTGIISSATDFFGAEFATVVLSQRFVMAVLLIFAISFAIAVSLRKHEQSAQPHKASRASKPSATKSTVRVSKVTRPAKTTRRSTKTTAKSTAKAQRTAAKSKSAQKSTSARKATTKKRTN